MSLLARKRVSYVNEVIGDVQRHESIKPNTESDFDQKLDVWRKASQRDKIII